MNKMQTHWFKTILSTVVIFTSSLQPGYGQEEKKADFNGYLTAMPQYSWDEYNKYYQGILHNRLNFHWYPSGNLTGSLQLRNQLMYGDFVPMSNPTSGLHDEGYFLPLSVYQTFGNKGLLSIAIDRLWMQYTKEKVELKIGRQRINWGQTFVWNPNDIFNSYNFFDFDYPERPGADAVRVQYYTGMTSSLDIAAKIDSGQNVTAAALYRFNKWNTDIQMLSGYYRRSSRAGKEEDWMVGLGATSDVKGLSLRGEGSYFRPFENFSDTTGLFLLSVGADYMFSNELYLSGEFLYQSKVNLGGGASFLDFYAGQMSVKNMSFTKYNIFAQASYPITPIFKTTLSGMVYTDDVLTGYFIGPYADLSLKDNMELSLYFQFFTFGYENPITGDKEVSNSGFAFLRYKWNF